MSEQQHDKDEASQPRPGDEIAPSRYRKLPVEIEAIRWCGTNLKAVIDFTGRHPSADEWTWAQFEEVVRTKGLKIFTLEGHHMASVGDYIIKGVHGEFYPCKPDIFWKTYERATAPLPETGSIEDVREKLRKSIEREQELERLLAEARGERNYFMGLVPPAPLSATQPAEGQTPNGLANLMSGMVTMSSLEHDLNEARRELAEIRDALAGADYASLPSDFPTARMAHTIRADHDKFRQQVKDTCARAEKAEAELAAARSTIQEPSAWIVRAKGEGTPQYLSWKKQAVGCARDDQCEFVPLYTLSATQPAKG